jgi:hypothetical protein
MKSQTFLKYGQLNEISRASAAAAINVKVFSSLIILLVTRDLPFDQINVPQPRHGNISILDTITII